MKVFLRYAVVFIFISTLFSPLKSNGQDIYKRKAIYAELLGSGVFGSLNYDFRFRPGNDGLGMRVGIGAIPSGILIPIGINDLIGKKKIAFEYGIGATAAIITGPISQNQTFNEGSSNFGVILYGKAGMRYTPIDNGLFFNIHWNPLINTEGAILAWLGIGVGYTWKHGVK